MLGHGQADRQEDGARCSAERVQCAVLYCKGNAAEVDPLSRGRDLDASIFFPSSVKSRESVTLKRDGTMISP